MYNKKQSLRAVEGFVGGAKLCIGSEPFGC